MGDLLALTQAIESGDRAAALLLTEQALRESAAPETVLDAMTLAMQRVGARFQRNEIYVPEMLIAARAMKEAMAILEPRLVAADIHPTATAVIGTVRGDLHDIGKNLVGMMWKGAQIDVIDLGTNVAPDRFVTAATEHGARLVGISALLTTTMIGMRDVVEAIRSADLNDIKIIVGGAPVTADFARDIGADGYALDAGSAVDVAQQLLSSAGR
jgi:5-methyltetrahydrofolate--homocysteine methyltransferase